MTVGLADALAFLSSAPGQGSKQACQLTPLVWGKGPLNSAGQSMVMSIKTRDPKS